MRKILVIDDDVSIGNMLEEVLKRAGYEVMRAYSGTEALLCLSDCRPDLILLDLMLPGLSGEELLPQIRGIPTIVLSAKASVDDKVSLLAGGAVDYLTKPFEVKELLARILVQFRESENSSFQSTVTAGHLKLDTESRELSCREHSVRLTRTEFAILKLLMQHSNQVISKNTILDQISLETPDCTDASLKQHISNLRRKIRTLDDAEHIEAVWGIGFRFLDHP